MEKGKLNLVSIEESNESFALTSEKAKEIQDISDKINQLMDSFIHERETKGLSQRDLASLLDWKQPALARMERLDVIPRLDTFLKAVMKVGGNVYIEYFDGVIPSFAIKSSSYCSDIVTTKYSTNNQSSGYFMN